MPRSEFLGLKANFLLVLLIFNQAPNIQGPERLDWRTIRTRSYLSQAPPCVSSPSMGRRADADRAELTEA